LALTDAVPLILSKYFHICAWGGLVAAAINYFRDGYVEVGFVYWNGTIAGLVG